MFMHVSPELTMVSERELLYFRLCVDCTTEWQDRKAGNDHVAISNYPVPKSAGVKGDFEHFQSWEQHARRWLNDKV